MQLFKVNLCQFRERFFRAHFSKPSFVCLCTDVAYLDLRASALPDKQDSLQDDGTQGEAGVAFQLHYVETERYAPTRTAYAAKIPCVNKSMSGARTLSKIWLAFSSLSVKRAPS